MKAKPSRCSSGRLPDVTKRLRDQSRKITGPREAVLKILRRYMRPLSAKEIFEELPSGGGDLATVYRSLHLLESMGLVKRFDLGGGGAKFELLAEGDDGHHHHLVCTRCSDVVEIEGCFPPELERTIANESGFKAVTHKLEFFGLCPRCQ